MTILSRNIEIILWLWHVPILEITLTKVILVYARFSFFFFSCPVINKHRWVKQVMFVYKECTLFVYPSGVY